YRRKEIDLVVRRDRTVAFVEVKGRTGSEFGHPLDAITLRKRADIQSVARWWIARYGRGGEEYRFDAVAVRPGSGGGLRVEHVEDAWQADSP
ncbi:MAG TPA: YraN family protein, partial [Longimicrobiales bacterium]|nr:YraN family protein [Longimicrobiales bacterium]